MIEYLLPFTAGLISFLSPCVLPLIPGYISFISGQSLQELLSEKKVNFFSRLIAEKSWLGFCNTSSEFLGELRCL